MKPGRILAGAALSALALCSGCGSTGAPEHADSSPTAASTANRAVVQESMDAVASQLRKFQNRDGYGGIAYDIGARTVNFWWKGELDPDVRTVLDHVRSDVTVKVRPAKFSRAELGAASDKINQTKAADGSYEVQAVTLESLDRPTFEYGLIVNVKLGPGADEDEVRAALSKAAGVPVTFSNIPMPTY